MISRRDHGAGGLADERNRVAVSVEQRAVVPDRYDPGAVVSNLRLDLTAIG